MATKRTGVACYDKAGEDEPIFVLRAQDTFAPALVRQWADKARFEGVAEAKWREAMDCADAMEAWPNKKVPD